MSGPFVSSVLSLCEAMRAAGGLGSPKIELPSVSAGQAFCREVCDAVGADFNAMWPVPYRLCQGIPDGHAYIIFAGVFVHFPMHRADERSTDYDRAIDRISKIILETNEKLDAGLLKPGAMKDHQAGR